MAENINIQWNWTGVKEALKGLRQSAQTTAKNISTSFKNSFNSVKDHLDSIKGAFTSLASVGFSTAVQMDAGLYRVQATLGVVGQRAQDIAKAAQSAWKAGFGSSLEEVNAQVAVLGQTFNSFAGMTKAEISSLVNGILGISKAFGQDSAQVAGSIKHLTATFKAQNLTAQQAMDVIAYGFKNGANSAGDLLNALGVYGPTFSALGFNAQEMVKFMVAGMNSGASSADELGQAFVRLQTNLGSISGKTKEELLKTGINLEDFQARIDKGGATARQALQDLFTTLEGMPEGDRLKAGAILFGESWAKMGPKALGAFQQVITGMDGVKGSAQSVAQNIHQDFGSKWEQVKRSAQSALGAVMLPLLKAISPILQPIANALQAVADKSAAFMAQWQASGSFTEAFRSVFSPEAQAAIIAVGTLLAGLLTAALVLLAVTLWSVAAAAWAAIAPFLPFIVAAMIIAGLALLIWMYWQQLVNFFVTAFTAVWNFIVGVFNAIVAFFMQWGLIILTVLMGPIAWIVALIVTYWNQIVAFTMAIWNGIVAFLVGLWNGIVNVALAVWNGLVNAILAVWNMLQNYAAVVWNAIVNVITGIWNQVQAQAVAVWNGIVNGIVNAWQALANWAANIWNGIANVIGGVVNAIVGFANHIARVINGIVNGIGRIGGRIAATIGIRGFAKGGVVSGPTLAVVGEGRYSEAVLPLSQKTFRSLAKGIVSHLPATAGGTTVQVQQLIVRNDQDIHLIAQKLHRLQQQKARAGGIMTHGSAI